MQISKIRIVWLRFIFLMSVAVFFVTVSYAAEIKKPCASGMFYPDNQGQLSEMLERLLETAIPTPEEGEILGLISPHAGYGYSGQVAAYGYSLIKGISYRTVVIIGSSHQYGFSGISVYAKGAFLTPLGAVQIDEDFAAKLLNRDKEIMFEPKAFAKEHSVEVQIPFLQKSLPFGFKIVPIITGDCSLSLCRKLASLLKDAIGERKDVLVIASTDLYHGYSYREAQQFDKEAISCMQEMAPEKLYYGLREGRYQLCGGLGVVSAIFLANDSGYRKFKLLRQLNSGDITGVKGNGTWIVGYASCVLYKEKKEEGMLTKEQKKRLLEIARNSLETYLKTGKRAELEEDDPLLKKEMGAFVTLHQQGELKGCIGNMVGRQPLYLTIRDMAIAAGTEDYRFNSVKLNDLKDIEFEISVLSPMKRVASADEIQLGVHGVMVKRGFNSGVFLPQVALETGWSKEKFLSELCGQKAGLSPDAWKDKSTELYIFSAEVFSEQDY